MARSIGRADLVKSVKLAVATFVFATTGVLVGGPVLSLSDPVWKLAGATGIGALINLAYRASERWLRDNEED